MLALKVMLMLKLVVMLVLVVKQQTREKVNGRWGISRLVLHVRLNVSMPCCCATTMEMLWISTSIGHLLGCPSIMNLGGWRG